MAEPITWLAVLVGLPAVVVGGAASRMHVERLRMLAVACALGLVCAAGVPLAVTLDLRPLSYGLLEITALTRLLLPFGALLWLLSVAVTPRSRLDRRGIQRTAFATLATTVSFMSTSPELLLALWAVSSLVFLAALPAPENRRARRAAAVYLGASTLFFGAGVVLLRSGRGSEAGVWCILVAALIRKGIVPFHAWLPALFDRGRIGPAVLFSAPQLGAYVTAVIVVPRAPANSLRVVAMLALITAVYGAALALHQRDARRSCGYLFVSQSALVMAGLDASSTTALAGALLTWISSGLAFAGIARCVLVLEARRGRLDLGRHHGGYERVPLLAVSFLVMGLACMGFPGTLGFVASELLVDGTVSAFPVLGFCIVAAQALTGVAILRMYFSLFCGARDRDAKLPLLRREALAFGAIAAVLILMGLAPLPLPTSQLAAKNLLRHGAGPRHAPAAGSEPLRQQ